MADNWAETTRTVSYEKAVEFQLNEQPGKLKPQVGSWKNVDGEKVEITDRFSDLYAEEIEGRHQQSKYTAPDVERRWIHKPNRSAIHVLVDPDDKMATEVDIRAPLPVGIARGIRRYQDDQWLVGFYGTAYTGKEGLTAVPFKSANVLAADTGETAANYTGLTLKKLRAIRKLFRVNLVDTEAEMIHMLVTAEEIDDLLQIDEYINSRYNPDSQMRSKYKPLGEDARQALQDGEPTPFLGIQFIPAEITNPKAYRKGSALTVNGSNHRRLPVYVPSGMAGRSWLDFEGKIAERPDINHSEQLSGYSACRFSRVHEDKCAIVECA